MKILAYTSPARGHLYPVVPILDELARRGHSIAVRTLASQVGLTQKALAAGVPVCVVPFGRDQLEIARRVEVAGAGTRLPARRLSAARLRSAVRVAMRKHDGARRVAEGYRATGGAATAADAFESLAAAWPPRAAARDGPRSRLTRNDSGDRSCAPGERSAAA